MHGLLDLAAEKSLAVLLYMAWGCVQLGLVEVLVPW